MAQRWQSDGVWVTGEEAVRLVRDRLERDERCTWFESDEGRVVAFVTNASRAMVTLLPQGGDGAGGHAVDPGAHGSSNGFVLDNGQDDEYEDQETVPLEDGLRVLAHLLDQLEPPADAPWETDD